ncbi:MAG TPA: WYL domain-containing protein [Pirellulales bacterium]|jgi:proteasome accessory factor B|nr:WYL domain-containing protein [Pirellulales bacterium]
MNHLSRVSRLVQLLGLLQAGRGHNATALAQACNVTRRTIFRDLVVLRDAGVPLLFDDDQGIYRIPGTYFLPPTNFTAEEALAVIVLCHELGGRRRLPFYHAAQNAALKLECSLPGGVRDHLRDVAGAVHINLPPGSHLDDKAPVYQQLLACIAARRSVRMNYDSFSDEGPIRLKLNPYRLLFSRHSWYVIGRSSLHREVRTFNVGRIGNLALGDEKFEIPRGFSIERYLGNAWHLIPEPGPDQCVVVRFSPLVARNVAEIMWHKTQRLVPQEDGSLDFYVQVSGIREISWWILGYGDQAEVLEPPALRRRIADSATRLLERYNAPV